MIELQTNHLTFLSVMYFVYFLSMSVMAQYFLIIYSTFSLTSAIRNGENAYEMQPDLRPTASLTVNMTPKSDNRLGGAAHIHPRFFLTMQKVIDLGAMSLTYRVGSLRMFEGGEVRKVDFCLQMAKDEIWDHSYRPQLCRLKLAVDWKGFGYLCASPWKPRGFDRSQWAREYFKFSGWHGWDDNWVNHQMNVFVTKEVSEKLDCNDYYEMGDKMRGPWYFNCYKVWGHWNGNPIPWETFPYIWDEGSPLVVKNTQLLLGLAIGRAIREWSSGPSLTCELELFVKEIRTKIVKYDYDEYWEFQEFYYLHWLGPKAPDIWDV